MGDAAGILIAVCAGIAVLSAAVGYVAERVVPVDKVQKPAAAAAAAEPPTIEKRVDTLETVVYNRNPQGAVAVPLPPPSASASEPPSEPQGAVAVPLTPDMLSLPPPAPPPLPKLGGGVRIRISG